MRRWHRVTMVARIALPTLLLAAAACGAGEDASAKEAATAREDQAPASEAAAIEKEGPVVGSLTIANAKPASGNTQIQMHGMMPLPIPGGVKHVYVGASGAVIHTLVLNFEGDALKDLEYGWRTEDDSLHVLLGADCAAAPHCPPGQVRGDAKTGGVVFSNLVMPGTDYRDGSAAVATLSGRLR